ncbi:Isotrichodermin C-15 hydroxylase [Achaetomium macrosporum]|uniref:Isotrichodermin C-15 hydroxylase n=1 Tax=Achaetomium macrosporum TaxID=79813 RepID=A0AAN7H6Q4_9PEZI|nr:Isotrichodermin C-15 hydroxylase [Achaetomium macrosporum]
MHANDFIHRIPPVHPWTVLWALLGLLTLAFLLQALYNLYLHQLARFPGPLMSRASPIPHALRLISGTGPLQVHRLHDRYGPVVRLSPDHLSFTDLRAWKDIYGHHVGAHENLKSKRHYPDALRGNLPTNIVSAGTEEHARLRRALAYGFSDRAMRKQEGLIKKYVDLLMGGIGRRAARGERVDIVKWYNWTTFDIVGDLVFAESFGCLKREDGHFFVDLITGLVKQGPPQLALRYLGLASWKPVRFFIDHVVPRFAPNHLKELRLAVRFKLKQRLEVKEDRSDLFEGIMKRREEWNLNMPKLEANAIFLVVAGSETTASLLSGATYLLLVNPDAMEKLKHEVRSSFNSADEITLLSVSRLHYMLACLNEALRRYPPTAANIARDVHQGGAIIAGHFVPEKTTVEVQPYSMNHTSLHWHDPYAFKPERFLHKLDSELGEGRMDEENAVRDHLEAMQAFSVGPRNCIGRNLAYAEMRLILARIIYDFDLRLADECKHWLQRGRVYTVWRKPPLYVYLTPVKRE